MLGITLGALDKSKNCFFYYGQRYLSYTYNPITRKIDPEILNARYKFLREHKMLENCRYSSIGMRGRTREIFRNLHLYEPTKENIERTAKGLPPIDAQNDTLVIHHFDQRHYGDWVILPNNFHCFYDEELHSKHSVPDGVNRKIFNKERRVYWKYESARMLLSTANDNLLKGINDAEFFSNKLFKKP